MVWCGVGEQCFFTVETGWGSFSQTGPAGLPTGVVTLSAKWGAVAIKSLGG